MDKISILILSTVKTDSLRRNIKSYGISKNKMIQNIFSIDEDILNNIKIHKIFIFNHGQIPLTKKDIKGFLLDHPSEIRNHKLNVLFLRAEIINCCERDSSEEEYYNVDEYSNVLNYLANAKIIAYEELLIPEIYFNSISFPDMAIVTGDGELNIAKTNIAPNSSKKLKGRENRYLRIEPVREKDIISKTATNKLYFKEGKFRIDFGGHTYLLGGQNYIGAKMLSKLLFPNADYRSSQFRSIIKESTVSSQNDHKALEQAFRRLLKKIDEQDKEFQTEHPLRDYLNKRIIPSQAGEQYRFRSINIQSDEWVIQLPDYLIFE